MILHQKTERMVGVGGETVSGEDQKAHLLYGVVNWSYFQK